MNKNTVKSPIKPLNKKKKKYCDDIIINKRDDNIYKLKLSVFPIIICGIFFCYWIIICPLIWAFIYYNHLDKTNKYLIYIFWIIAFIIWLFINLILIFQRVIKNNRDKKFIVAKNTELEILKSNINGNDEVDDHISRELNRNSIKEYLKIVTIETPSPKDEIDDNKLNLSPSSESISPRELFFRDLYRNVDKDRINYKTRPVTVADYQRKFKRNSAEKKLSKSNNEINKIVEEKLDSDNSDERIQSEFFIAHVTVNNKIEKSQVFINISTDENK